MQLLFRYLHQQRIAGSGEDHAVEFGCIDKLVDVYLPRHGRKISGTALRCIPREKLM